VLDRLIASTVSRRPVASVAALGLMSVLACVSLTACDAAAEHRTMPPMSAMSPMSAPPVAAGVASSPSMGAAALQEHREDVDPSHAAIGSYRD